ncbi:MAG: RagB/SusD family nutrient uptake outer membrane protein, partial [Bacteroidales bacterium]|nr:RagB/SusD family nutrient uptake outer membrane protein [Bacteroidales bacterium]
MKTNRINSIFLILTGILCFFSSCEDEEFLMENPKSFNAPENIFINTKGFETALNGCYHLVQREYSNYIYECLFAGTDLALNAQTHGYNAPPELLGESMTSEYACSQLFWDWCYELIANANLIIEAIDNPDIKWDLQADKDFVEAEARFFRAYAYRILTYTFGDVPLVDEVPKP